MRASANHSVAQCPDIWHRKYSGGKAKESQGHRPERLETGTDGSMSDGVLALDDGLEAGSSLGTSLGSLFCLKHKSESGRSYSKAELSVEKIANESKVRNRVESSQDKRKKGMCAMRLDCGDHIRYAITVDFVHD